MLKILPLAVKATTPLRPSTKCEVLRASQETLPSVNYLVSILNFVAFQRSWFSSCKMSCHAKDFLGEIYNNDNSPSRTESLRVCITQRSR